MCNINKSAHTGNLSIKVVSLETYRMHLVCMCMSVCMSVYMYVCACLCLCVYGCVCVCIIFIPPYSCESYSKLWRLHCKIMVRKPQSSELDSH